MAPDTSKKRKLDKVRAPVSKKLRRQLEYNSDSSEDNGVTLPTVSDAPKPAPKASLKLSSAFKPPKNQLTRSPDSSASASAVSDTSKAATTSASSDSSSALSSRDSAASDSDPSPTHLANNPKKSKRHDPSAFASSLTAILNTPLTKTKGADPVLSRSRTAADATKELADSKLESRAKRKIKEERRLAKEKGRVRDVLLGDKPRLGGGLVVGEDDDVVADHVVTGLREGEGADGDGMSAAEIAAQERRLRKTAQRGVVKLFNAVRAAQVRGEEEARKTVDEGLVGVKKREERIGEMGRGAFLELVGGGGGKGRK